MKHCGYCGRENDEQAEQCVECGTSLAPTADPALTHATPADDPALAHTDVPPLIPTADQAPTHTERPLNARCATLILVVYFAAQFIVGMYGGLMAHSLRGSEFTRTERDSRMRTITGPTAVLAVVVGGVVMFLVSRAWVGQRLPDTSPTGAAWVPGSAKHIVQGLGGGALTGLCYLALAMLFPHGGDQPVGPVTRMSVTPGLQQSSWLLLGLVLAPVVEELLFRGVMYGGYRNSFGPIRAALLTTGIFWLLHIGEMIYFLPAMVGIAALALVALWFRLRSAAIGPAVAAHFGYNAVLAVLVVCSTL